MNCKKIDFKGQLQIEGVCGGDTYPYWIVSKEVYEKITGIKTNENICKLYLNQLIDYENEGKKQSISLRIVTD